MNMIKRMILLLLPALLMSVGSRAQSTSPSAAYTNSDGDLVEENEISDAEAPLDVTFKANPTDMDDYTPSYEWHFKREGEETDFLVRYEEETSYRFVESGTFFITLKTRLDSDTEQESEPIKVIISASHLEMPNAFSPNDDGYNDKYGAKGVNDPQAEGRYKSIVEFHAWIFNRWGQKLYEWTDVGGSWDGKYKGSPVKEGVYFVLVKAKGADGREYNIKRDVNLMRARPEETSDSSSSTEE